MKIIHSFLNRYDIYKKQLFSIGLILYISSLLLRSTTYLYTQIPDILNFIFSGMSYLSYFIMLIIIILDNIRYLRYLITRFSFYVFLLFSLLLFYITMKTDTRPVLYAFFAILAAKNISFKYILKLAFLTSVITTTLIVILSISGFLPDWIFYRGDSIRHSFGFYYTTTLSHIFFFDVLAFIALKKDLNVYNFGSILIINSFIYFFTKSRNSFLLILLCLLIYFLLFKQKKINLKTMYLKFNQINKLIIDHFYTFMFIISLFISYLYNSQSTIWQVLNTLLNNRILLMSNALHQYGITLFGQYVKWIGMTDIEKFGSYLQYNYVDNAYIQLFIVQGIILSIFLYFIFYRLMKSLRTNNRFLYLFCMIFIAIHSLVDPQLLYLEMNMFLFLLTPIIYKCIYGYPIYNSSNTPKKILLVGSDKSVKGGMVSVMENYINYKNNQFIYLFIPTHINESTLKKIFFFLKNLYKIWKIIKYGQCNIIHLHVAERGSFFRKSIIVLMCKYYHRPVILHQHGAEFCDFYDQSNFIIKNYIDIIHRLADINIVLNQETFDRVSNKRNNVIIVNNGVFCDKNLYNPNANEILFLGTFCVRKGIFDLLQCIYEIDDKLDRNILFNLCGNGDIETIKKNIQQLNIEHRIHYIGWIDDNKKKEIFSKTILNILPSYNEGLPMSILETMAYGIPNISTNIAAIPTVISSESLGTLIRPGDIRAMGDAILKLVNNQNYRKSVSIRSHCLIKDKYSIDAHMKIIFQLYNQLIKNYKESISWEKN